MSDLSATLITKNPLRRPLELTPSDPAVFAFPRRMPGYAATTMFDAPGLAAEEAERSGRLGGSRHPHGRRRSARDWTGRKNSRLREESLGVPLRFRGGTVNVNARRSLVRRWSDVSIQQRKYETHDVDGGDVAVLHHLGRRCARVVRRLPGRHSRCSYPPRCRGDLRVGIDLGHNDVGDRRCSDHSGRTDRRLTASHDPGDLRPAGVGRM